MPSPESNELQGKNELQGYLDELIAATRKGSIQWVAANPTTFLWDTGAELRGARISLQRVDRTVPTTGIGGIRGMRRMAAYIFQAFEIEQGRLVLRVSVDSSEDESVGKKLETLFDFIKTGVSRKGLEFLKDLIPRQ
jgi:hypothetical protein